MHGRRNSSHSLLRIHLALLFSKKKTFLRPGGQTPILNTKPEECLPRGQIHNNAVGATDDSSTALISLPLGFRHSLSLL